MDKDVKEFVGWASKLRQIARVQIGRVLGTVPSTHGGYKTFIDLLERSYFMRAELNALISLLLSKGILTEDEIQASFAEEFERYFNSLKAQWPEIEFDAHSFTIKDVPAFAERAKREAWPK